MKHQKQALLLGSSSALLAALVAGAWAFLEIDSVPSRRLPDGSLLSLESAGRDRPQVVLAGPTWQRRLYPFLPLEFRNGLAVERLDVPGWHTGGLVACLGHWHTSHPAMPDCVLVDRHGCEIWSSAEILQRFEKGRGYAYVQLFSFFPRRERDFRLRAFLSPASDRQPVAEFPVLNPYPGQYPQWTPEQLPATRKTGGITVALTQVTAGLSFTDRKSPARSGTLPFTRVEYQVWENGQPTRGWKPVGLVLSDATGCSHRFRMYELIAEPGERFCFWAGLCRRESAYKIRLEFSRCGQGPPDAVKTLRGIALSRRFGVTRVPAFPGVTVESAAGGMLLNGQRWVLGGVVPSRGGLAFSLSGVDNRGRKFVGQRAGYRNQNPRIQPFGLRVSKNATSFDLKMGLYRSRFVEFQVRPSWVGEKAVQ